MHLSEITHPNQLRNLSLSQLRSLARQIREKHLQTAANSPAGCHLGPGLGVVELTLALYKTLDLDRDKVIWDVGHQAYAHKMLTGRYHNFHTIRQKGGISGYLKRSESRFDHFGAGHASTSISAALGMAIARDRRGENFKVVAIIGDGALTGGMAYEAINHAGHLPKTNLMVILNDNGMSISPNVGGHPALFKPPAPQPTGAVFGRQPGGAAKEPTSSWLQPQPGNRPSQGDGEAGYCRAEQQGRHHL